jgi:hypothetical protein
MLADRLRQYEAVLQEQGIDPNRLPDSCGFELNTGDSMKVSLERRPTPAAVVVEPHLKGAQMVRSQGRLTYVEK